MKSTAAPRATATKILGNTGEWIAMQHLHRLGYEIWDTNVRLGRDEIDILAFDPMDSVLVFAEVKTRTKMWKGFLPEKTASEKKRIKLRRAARKWVDLNEFRGGYRIDLVCVQKEKVTEHFKELSWE